MPVVSASVTWSTPASRARSTSAATSSGVISSPSNGEPKQHEITTSSTASGAAARIAATLRRSASLDRHVDVLLAVRRRRRHGDREVVDAGRGRQLGALDVGHERPQRDVVGDGRRRSPRRHRPRRPSPAPPSATTNEATSMSSSPAAISRAISSTRCSGRTGRSPCRPSRATTSRIFTRHDRWVSTGPFRPQNTHRLLGGHTGGTPWRRSAKWRSLWRARAMRRISSARRSLGLDDGVDDQLGRQAQQVDVRLVDRPLLGDERARARRGPRSPRSCWRTRR